MSILSVHDLQGIAAYQNKIRVPSGHQLGFDGTLKIPVWTTETRPTPPEIGLIGYNSSSGVASVELYDGEDWVSIGGALRKDSDSMVKSGLVVFLDAGDTDSYPGSGNSWYDLSGNGNDGTLIDGPVYNSSGGGCLSFGSPTTTKVSLSTSDYGSDSFTISMWFNCDSLPTTYHMLLGASNYSGATGIGHYLYSDTIRTWVSGTTVNIYNSGSILSAGTWYNLDIVREYGVAWKWYLNGNLINTYTSDYLTTNYISPNSYIGNHYNSASYPFYGKVSVLRAYNRALSASEVLQNYNALKARYGL